jgi:hypothetical protein
VIKIDTKISHECINSGADHLRGRVLHKRDQRDVQYIISIHHLFIMLHLININQTYITMETMQAASSIVSCADIWHSHTVTCMQFAVVVYIM